MRILKKLLSIVGMLLLVPVLMFEEWGWEPLARAVAQLARLPMWARMELYIRALPPWAAVALFFVPVLLLLPVKLFGLILLGSGHTMSAVALLLIAKLIGTAIVARIFQLVEPALMRIPLFAIWFPRWITWKNLMLARARESRPWRVIQALNRRLVRSWRRLRQG